MFLLFLRIFVLNKNMFYMIPLEVVCKGHSEGDAIRLRICVVPPQSPWQWNGIGRKTHSDSAVKFDEFGMIVSWAGNESLRC